MPRGIFLGGVDVQAQPFNQLKSRFAESDFFESFLAALALLLKNLETPLFVDLIDLL